MDTASHTFHETARHDDVVSFEHATTNRRTNAGRAAAELPVATSCGGGWYHDAAIASAQQEAVEARSNPYHH